MLSYALSISLNGMTNAISIQGKGVLGEGEPDKSGGCALDYLNAQSPTGETRKLFENVLGEATERSAADFGVDDSVRPTFPYWG